MKKCFKVLCGFSVLAVLASCGISQNSSSPAESNKPSSTQVVSQSSSQVTTPATVNEICTLKGGVSLFGYSVNATLTLNDDNTAAYTLDYGKDVGSFTWTDVTWALDTTTGTTVVSVPNADPEGNVTYDTISLYVVGENYYGIVATNLGNVLISTADDVSLTATLAGGIDLYGYKASVSLQLISDGAALYTLDYGVAGGKFTLPTTWAVDQATGTVTAVVYNISAEGGVATQTVTINTATNNNGAFYSTYVPTNLGEVEITNGVKTVTMAGSYDLYGMYKVEASIAVYEKGYAVCGIEYFQNTDAGYVSSGAMSYGTTWDPIADSTNITVHTYSFGADGSVTPADVVITVDGGVYSATLATNIGNCSITSAPSQA